MHGPNATPKPSDRPGATRRYWLFAVLTLVVLAIAGFDLNEERRKLELLQRRIDVLWVDLEKDLQAKAVLATELVEVVDRARLRAQGRDFLAARNSVAGSARHLKVASGRADLVEANLSLDRALRQFMDSLAEEATHVSGSRAWQDVRRAQESILVAEHRVAMHRTAYNEAVQHFNTHLALFPANYAGVLFGIRRDPRYMPTNIRDIVQLPSTPSETPTREGKNAR